MVIKINENAVRGSPSRRDCLDQIIIDFYFIRFRKIREIQLSEKITRKNKIREITIQVKRELIAFIKTIVI